MVINRMNDRIFSDRLRWKKSERISFELERISINLFQDQAEQQVKDYRIQIKQITNERQQMQEQFDQIKQQFTSISNEKVRRIVLFD